MSHKYILGFWDIRGRAEPIRLVLSFVNAPFVERAYDSNSRESWYAVKYGAGFDLPNLPYLIDESENGSITKVTQTVAILRHLARRYDLGGRTDAEKVKIEIIEQHVHDLVNRLIAMCYNERTDDRAKREYVSIELPRELSQLSDLFSISIPNRKEEEMNHNLDDDDTNRFGHFVAGPRLTYVDFYLFDFLLNIRALVSDEKQKMELKFDQNLIQFLDRMSSLPPVKRYLQRSAAAGSLWINNRNAKWNAKY